MAGACANVMDYSRPGKPVSPASSVASDQRHRRLLAGLVGEDLGKAARRLHLLDETAKVSGACRSTQGQRHRLLDPHEGFVDALERTEERRGGEECVRTV